MQTSSSRPLTILRLRRFGNARARDAALAARPGGEELSVTEQQELLDRGHGPFSSPLIPELGALGWDAHELILGVPSVRRAWEREHRSVPDVRGVDNPDALLAIAEAQRVRPDVILDSNLNVLDRRALAALRRLAPEVRLLAGYMGTEKRFHRALGLDLVLVPCHSMAAAIRSAGDLQVEVLPHSFDPRTVDRLPPRTVTRPLVFAGALGPRYVERHRVLMALLEQTELEAWVGLRKGVERTADGWLVTTSSEHVRPEVATSRPSRRGTSLRGRIGDTIPTGVLARLARRSERAGAIFNTRMVGMTGGAIAAEAPMRDPAALHPDRCHPPVSGHEYLELLRSSGTVLHRGIDALGGCGGALRLFEVTGVGAALLLEDSPMVHELFEVGREVITYRDADEAVKRARWLSAYPEERERIAAAGQARTLTDHSAAARARRLDPILREAIMGGGRARRRSGAVA